jgi:hypothetical protein
LRRRRRAKARGLLRVNKEKKNFRCLFFSFRERDREREKGD